MEDIVRISLIELVGDAGLREFAVHDDPIGLALGLGGYGLLLSHWTTLLRKRSLGWSNAAWDGMSSLITFGFSRLVLGETSSARETMGAILVITGLFFLGDGENSPPVA